MEGIHVLREQKEGKLTTVLSTSALLFWFSIIAVVLLLLWAVYNILMEHGDSLAPLLLI